MPDSIDLEAHSVTYARDVMARFIGSLVLIALAVGGTFATWPQLADLEMIAPWAQIVAMRGLGAAIALFIALVLFMIRAGATSKRGFIGALAFLFFAFAVANTAILFVRGVFPAELAKPTREDVRVLAWNTLGDRVAIEYLERAVDGVKAEVIVLPETTRGYATQLADALRNNLGSEFTVHTVALDDIYKARSTSVLVSRELGEYRITSEFGDTNVLPSVVLEPVDRGSRPRIVGIHSVSPIEGEMDRWREDTAWLGSLCELPNTIIAGDANATPDQLRELDGCSLSSLQAGAGGLGTWPATLPAILGAQVDQVLTTSMWRATGFRVLSEEDASGSDHRPIAAVLVPADE